ncbi:MAG: hybrid sensor histidine kinase/response regulator [bacterium]|nr:hybrid sensor histidine kinase/response regulator [Myxococcales bacterium]MCB9551980.1 hybrid sensor histidine kinase/response regulator [Myxococcales bacterium]
MNVLHIEDRPENRRLVRKVLEAKGFEVTDAADGLTGIELACTTQPDLILIDINIPHLNGYEVVTRLRSEPHLADTPIVAITAEGDRTRALALGFDGFIVKPIRIVGFADELQAFLAGRRESVDEAEKTAQLAAHSREVVERLEGQVRALTRANERLREVDRLKMEVLRNVSHELSTPMTPLVGYVRLLAAGELGPVSEGQQKVLDRMDASLQRLKGLIDNLLNVTRFATGDVAMQRGIVDPLAVVQRVVRAMGEFAAAHRVTLALDAPGRVEPCVGDGERLVDAVRQLVDNAIKFGPDGGTVRVGVRALVEGDEDRRVMEFSVTDEGPGIPPDKREQVVQPFYQIDGSATRAHGGAGLGLAIAHRTAELHGGRLVITRSPEGGGRVALRVPTRPVV